MVEQEGHGVREDLAQQSACQMPQITRPHLLYAIALGELRKNGVYPVAKPTEQGALFWGRVSLLGGIRGQKLHTNARQFLAGLWRMVVAVCDDQPRSSLDNLWEHAKLVDVGRGYRDAADHPRPADPYVHPEAIEGLFEEGVLAESGLSFKTPTAVGTSEQAHRQRQRVTKREGGIMRDLGQELLPEALLDLPEVGRLPALKVVRSTRIRFGKK
jgi:hypothetical protein